MSSANPDLHTAPEGWLLVLHWNDSYMAGTWSGYGYCGIVAVHPEAKFSGTFRNIPGRQLVVDHRGKFHARGQDTELSREIDTLQAEYPGAGVVIDGTWKGCSQP